MNESFELTHGQVLGFLRRGLFFALIVSLGLGAGLYYWKSLAGPTFSAQAVIVTQSPQTDLRSLGLPEVNNAPLHVDAYSVAATSTPVLTAALSSLGLPAAQAAVEDLRKEIQIRVVPEPKLMFLTITDSEPDSAAALANAVSEQLQLWDRSRITDELQRVTTILRQRIIAQQVLVEQLAAQAGSVGTTQLASERLVLTQLDSQLDSVVTLSTNTTGTLKVLRAAAPPEKSIGRPPVVFALLGIILGGLLAYALVFIVELVDGRLYSSEEVERATGLPVLGALHRWKRSHDTASRPATAMTLQANLEATKNLSEKICLVVTSVGYQDDPATAAMALAESFAIRGKSTLLVDADLQQPAIARRYRVPGINSVSLMAYIRGRQGMQQPIRMRIGESSHLALLYEAKPTPDEAPVMLNGLAACLKLWTEQYDAVIVRATPMSWGSDAMIISRWCDGVVLAVNPRATNRRALLSTVTRLRRAGILLVGAITTGLSGTTGLRLRSSSPTTSDLIATTTRAEIKSHRTS